LNFFLFDGICFCNHTLLLKPAKGPHWKNPEETHLHPFSSSSLFPLCVCVSVCLYQYSWSQNAKFPAGAGGTSVLDVLSLSLSRLLLYGYSCGRNKP
jgi:hypothetical protein